MEDFFILIVLVSAVAYLGGCVGYAPHPLRMFIALFRTLDAL